MDVNLPDTDGVTLTRKIKESPHLARIPILMLTGERRRETLTRSISAGAEGFVVKPFTREVLISKMDQLMSRATNA